MSIVMGQISIESRSRRSGWIPESGEVSRARVRPSDRGGVRRFLERFAGRELEVALEATTGWWFVCEEARAIGAIVHLAEPAETSALRGCFITTGCRSATGCCERITVNGSSGPSCRMSRASRSPSRYA